MKQKPHASGKDEAILGRFLYQSLLKKKMLPLDLKYRNNHCSTALLHCEKYCNVQATGLPWCAFLPSDCILCKTSCSGVTGCSIDL